MQGLAAIKSKLDYLRKTKKDLHKAAIDALMENDYIVVDMVFEEQLYMEGVNGRDIPIMNYEPYSPTTVWLKQQKGQPHDRVTLRDEGDFHSGGKLVRVDDYSAEIISDDWKTEWLRDRYGEEIFILKPDNLNELREHYIKPFLIALIKKGK